MRSQERIRLKQYRHSLSAREALVLSELSFEGKSLFRVEDLPSSLNKGQRRSLLDSLRRKRWIIPIQRGVYGIVPLEAGERGSEGYALDSFTIASTFTKPYYIAYGSALNFHGLTDQIPPVVYVASPHPQNSRRILEYDFRFVTLPPQKFFGGRKFKVGKGTVWISSKEKTIVDCLDHPEHCAGVEPVAQALAFYQSELQLRVVLSEARKMENSAILKRLGYLGEKLGIRTLTEAIRPSDLKSGYSFLDPSSPRTGRIVERWKVIVNVPIAKERWMG